MARHFNTTGPCMPHMHYMLPPADRLIGASLNRYLAISSAGCCTRRARRPARKRRLVLIHDHPDRPGGADALPQYSAPHVA
ncbi:MAG: hypothetical protein A3K19_25075 [Lentisphaerae bacterium RIFOXYB12_FULL_65_16]|nr:MAG: hypothetical protein A3K18_00830 [Lentisphaerae bacterium RIFOXYA12_64_32]OGV91019.1 MAG: hypothetical protein A3K19_25075 [Lentisphaerae bacterium RIFOXYB12_FULL_65_16]